MNLDDRRARLRCWIEEVNNQVSDLLIDQYIFTSVGEIVQDNAELRQMQSHFFQWMISSYVESAALSIRRQVEKKDAISIGRILDELTRFPQVMTLNDHASLYDNDRNGRYFARETYSHFARDGRMELDVDLLLADASLLSSKCRLIKHYADRRIAHYDSRGVKMQTPTFKDLDESIDCIKTLSEKYYLLIEAVSTDLMPVFQYDWTQVFNVPWTKATG